MKGIPFIVSAPSGAGKTTLCNMAVDFFPDLRHSISYTTRPSRPGETNGVEYKFVDDGTFDKMIERGEFLEYAGVFGKRYGTSKKDLDKLRSTGVDALLEIDVQGGEMVKGLLEGGVYVFILPPSINACEDRLKGRGKDTAEEIKRRLAIATDEMKRASDYDYIIINDDLNAAFEKLKSIVISERARSVRMMDKVKGLIGGSE